jgi:hypothetical protein
VLGELHPGIHPQHRHLVLSWAADGVDPRRPRPCPAPR